MLEIKPNKTFRALTWDEIASHKDEIPDGAIMELNVYMPENSTDPDISLDASLARLLQEASQLQNGDSVPYADARKIEVVDAVKRKFVRQGFRS